MSKADRPLLADVQESVRALAGDARQMLLLRWELARLELETDLLAVRRLAIRAAVAGVLALTALPLAAVALADWLDGWLLPRAGWLVVLAVLLLGVAGLMGLLAQRRFRRDFTALAETREELREDLVWLREWTAPKKSESP
jgi:hypothetical protein